ncbi:MAG: hypothetical protein R3E95_02095 [Thiolinea sp.]
MELKECARARHAGERQAAHFGMIQRSRRMVIRMLASNRPPSALMQETVAAGTLVYTDEYTITAGWKNGSIVTRPSTTVQANMPGMRMATVSAEVHVNTMEGFWSLLRSWRRPHRCLTGKSCRVTWLSSVSAQYQGNGGKPPVTFFVDMLLG